MRAFVNALPLVAAFLIPAAGMTIATRRERAHQERMRREAYADREDLQ